MKSLNLLLIIFMLFAGEAFAQNKVAVSGKIIDKGTEEPLPFASIVLYHGTDTLVVDGTITDENGIFILNDLNSGNYRLKISYIGYKAEDKDFMVGKLNKNLDLGKIRLQQDASAIEEVVVSAQRSSNSFSLSKKSYNISDNIASGSGSVLDAMRNLPGVTVDPEGKILLRGSDKVTVLVDGKRSSLTGFGSQKGLDNIPTSNIERIEIINNPSAKQEAQGMAGIVNIIYKKDKRSGINGNAGFNFGLGELNSRKDNLPDIMDKYSWTPKYNPSLSLNYRKEKINIFLQADGMFRKKVNSNEFVTRNYQENAAQNISSQFLENRSQQMYDIKLGMDWELSQQDILTFYGLWEDEYHIDKGDVPYDYISDGSRKRLWQWAEDENTRVMNYSLNYRHQFLQPGRTFEAGLYYSHGKEDELFPFSDTANGKFMTDSTHLISKEKNFILNMDYVQPFSNSRLEAGANVHMRNIPISYRIMPGEQSILDSHLGEWSKYAENIYAGYLNYILETKYLDVEAGLRLEYSTVRYKIDPNNQYYNRNESYNDLSLFPNVRLTYKMNEKNRLSVFYNRRIDRPQEFDLRPFPKYDDPEVLKTGNPYLRPQFTQAVELAYKNTWKSGSFYLSGYYKHTNDILTRIYTTNKDLSLNAITQNLNDGRNFGTELLVEQEILSGWKMSAGFNWYRNVIESASGTAIYPYEQAFTFDESKTNSWNLKLNTHVSLPKDYELQAGFIYYAPDIIPQGKILGRNSLDLGIRKKLLHDKMEVSLSATDILNKSGIRQEIYGNGFIMRSDNYYESQVVMLGVKYAF